MGGVTSKGYYIELRGKNLIVKFGSIHTFKRKFYWAGPRLPMLKPRKLKTLAEAKSLYNDRIRRINNEGYSRLMSTTQIRPFKKLDK